MITLVSGDRTWELPLSQAEAVLKVQAKMKATTWELPSQYQLTEDGITLRADKTVSQGKAKKKGTGTGAVASE